MIEAVVNLYLCVGAVSFAVLFFGAIVSNDDLGVVPVAISVVLVPLLWPLVIFLCALRYMKKGYI